MKKQKTKAETIATFIVQNHAFCPVDAFDNSIAECDGWRSKKCVNCIVKHCNELFVQDDKEFF